MMTWSGHKLGDAEKRLKLSSLLKDIAVDFHPKLYTAEDSDPQSQAELFQLLPKLIPDQQQDLDSPLTSEEVIKAVQELPTSQTPGLDGIPTEFYKEFWDAIIKMLLWLRDVFISWVSLTIMG
ncbi:receptor-type tyrosine-protein phosphatase F-like [Tachysurus ichikawai]